MTSQQDGIQNSSCDSKINTNSSRLLKDWEDEWRTFSIISSDLNQDTQKYSDYKILIFVSLSPTKDHSSGPLDT